MDLNRAGRQYVYFAWEGVPSDAPSPDVELTGTWVTMEWYVGNDATWRRVLDELDVKQAEVDSGDVRISRVLVSGPDAPLGPGLSAPRGRTIPQPRLAYGDEIHLPEPTGAIDID